jgi:hypothetical protein
MYVKIMKSPEIFREMLEERGYSTKAIKDLWKWFDYSEKKGVASY